MIFKTRSDMKFVRIACDILEGTVTEFRDGGYQKEYGPGGVITESRDVTHWAENKGAAKAVLSGVDLVKP